MINSLLRFTGAGLLAFTLAACETDMATHDPHYSHPTTVQQKTANMVAAIRAGMIAPIQMTFRRDTAGVSP